MKINPLIFRAYDIRGIYGKDITEELFQKIGFVLGREKKKFLVGHDIRKSGRSLAEGLISGLQRKGAEVFFAGRTPFGLCLFSGLKLGVYKTIFITASHLPSQWNGMKIYFGDGLPISEKEIKKIGQEVQKIKDKKINFKKPKIEKFNFKKEYSEFLLKNFSLVKNSGLKIVLDCGNGSMGLVAPQIFKKFGFRTVEIFSKIDPNFSCRPPEPKPEALKFLKEKVLKEKADFGIAFDGDGDRVALIDDKGRYLGGNEIGILIGKEIVCEQKNKNVVITVACSMAIKEQLKKLGAKIFEIPVGHTFVISAVKEKKACLGIEESGHIVLPQYFLFDDALLVPLKMAEIVLKSKKKLSQLIKEIKIYPFEEIVFDCPDKIKFGVLKRLIGQAKKRYKKINTIDGLKIYFNFGWVLIRASNTSPKIRLYIEAKTEKKLKVLKNKFSKILRKCIQQ